MSNNDKEDALYKYRTLVWIQSHLYIIKKLKRYDFNLYKENIKKIEGIFELWEGGDNRNNLGFLENKNGFNEKMAEMTRKIRSELYEFLEEGRSQDVAGYNLSENFILNLICSLLNDVIRAIIKIISRGK